MLDRTVGIAEEALQHVRVEQRRGAGEVEEVADGVRRHLGRMGERRDDVLLGRTVEFQGYSLVPLLDDPTASVRSSVLVEDDFPAAEVQRALPHKTRTVITETHRYTRDSNGYEALYDLVEDPHEIVNLAVDGRAPIERAEQIERLADALIHADDMTRYEGPTVDASVSA